MVHKQPMAAWEDSEFATEAHEMTGTTFIAHVRYATTGGLDVVNTHPFLQDGRMFAHNGVVEGLDAIDARLHDLGTADLVAGQSDSERVFALITGYTRARGGDVSAGLRDAVGWLADNVPVFALNVLLCTATDLWALRYPEPHQLYLLDRRRPRHTPPVRDAHQQDSHPLRPACGVTVGGLRHRANGRRPGLESARAGRAGARRRGSAHRPASRVPDPPAHQLSIADLTATAAAAQQMRLRQLALAHLVPTSGD